MNEQILDMIRGWLEPELERRNLFLVDLKSSGGKKYEVFIDGEVNVTIDECAEVSRFLEKLLDEEGSVPEDYNLEVSSPGMSNPLRVPQQYRKRIGRVLDIWLDESKIEALLVQSDEEGITVKELVKEKSSSKNKSKKKEIKTREEEMKIPYTHIKKALLQFNF